jgi:hypothetical protein
VGDQDQGQDFEDNMSLVDTKTRGGIDRQMHSHSIVKNAMLCKSVENKPKKANLKTQTMSDMPQFIKP